MEITLIKIRARLRCALSQVSIQAQIYCVSMHAVRFQAPASHPRCSDTLAAD